MSGLSPKLPLTVDENDGAYKLNKTFEELAHQNLKMLLLTSPGERVMDPIFGVGLKHYLFEQSNDLTYDEIRGKVKLQVSKYMPYLQLDEITVNNPGSNAIYIKVSYTILPLSISAILEITERVD
jgi:hypothetical protein